MKLMAAKFALLVFVLLALGMFVAAAPQSGDDDITGITPVGSDSSDDSTTPSTDESEEDTSTGGDTTGSDTDTGDDSSTSTPGKSDDEEPSTPPSRGSGGSSKSTPEPDDDDADDDATSKSPKSGRGAKSNNDDDDNNRNSNTNSNGSRSGKNNNNSRNRNNNNANDRSGNAKNAKNTDPSESAKQDNGAEETDPASPSAEVPAGTDDAEEKGNLTEVGEACSKDEECDSGSCKEGKCAEKEDDDKIGKTLGMALGIIVAVMCIGMVLLTGVRMMLKRRRSDYYAKRISEVATPSRATTPSFYHDSSSLVLEKQARNGNYSFKSPEAAVSSDNVRPPAQGYVYGAADGYDMDQSYTRTGVPNYTNDQHLYAPNASANDWAITPTYGAFPTTPAPDASPIPVPQPTMLPAPAMSPIPPRNVQPPAGPHSNGSNALGDLLARELTGGAGDRDSELIMYGGAASQNLTRESVYDASDDQNDGGRYKMNSIYSAYGRDSLYADTKDTPSVPNVPDLPSQYQKRDNY